LNILINTKWKKNLCLELIDFNLLLSSVKYRDILEYVWTSEWDILSKLKLSKYLIEMDVPFNKLTNTLDRSNEYDFNKLKTWNNDIKTILWLITEEYWYSDAKKYRL